METTRQFLNQRQPQTLQGATILFYLNAVFGLLSFGRNPFFILVILGAAAGYFIANEKKWGFYGGLAIAGILLAFEILLIATFGLGFNTVVGLIFRGLLVYLLLHPMSRHYMRLWFK